MPKKSKIGQTVFIVLKKPGILRVKYVKIVPLCKVREKETGLPRYVELW